LCQAALDAVHSIASKYSNGRFSGRFLLVKLGSGQHVTNRRQIDQFLPITPLCGIFAFV
jgi:hypothetical protein